MTLLEDDPAAFFDDDLDAATHIPQAQLEALQLAGLKRRFGEMRDRLPPLKALADVEGIASIERFDDVAPLLFPHTFYKSYPADLLEHRRFDAMTRWVSRLTTHDLSAIEHARFDSIDAWLDAMDERTSVYMLHSTGTTGGLSFLPRGREEVATAHRYMRAIAEWYRVPGADRHMPVIWPGYAHGRQAALRATEHFIHGVAGSHDDFYALIDWPMSADLQFYQMRINDAAFSGAKPDVEATPHIRAELDKVDQLQRFMRQRTDGYLERIARDLKGRRVALAGGPAQIFKFSLEALEKGYRNMFAPGSTITLFGGTKGVAMPDDWVDTVRQFAGDPRFVVTYGMTELCCDSIRCENDRFHPYPGLIPFVLDSETGAPLPRSGVQRGRAAYFDLIPRSYWGGFVSGDEVEIDWSPCACGRTSPHFSEDITRCDDGREVRTEIGALSTAGTRAALSALNSGLG